MEIIKASLAAALHSNGGGSNLGSVTFTENDTYTPTQPLDGWDEVTVQVPTYEDEYEDALERIAELEEEVEECDQCKADVIAKLQEYDPNFDPQTCEDISKEVGKVAGYKPPNDPPREDVVDAIEDLGGGDVDTVATGTSCGYTYKLEFAGWAQYIDSMREPITGEAINNIITSGVYNSFVEGQFVAGGYIYPVCKITIEGLQGRNWGYVGGGIGFLNGGGGWPVVVDSEWKFGISDIALHNDPDGTGCWINAIYYPSDAGWWSTNIGFAGVITKDSVTTTVYTEF